MAAAISNWYHSSLWTRNRQVQVAPLLARAEENARLGRPPAEAVVINMGDILADDPALLNAIRPKKHETLFGPSLGEINPGPAWTGYGKDAAEGGKADELTQETVRAWIAKSKEPSQPTTTLQALVNLKRPSIKLSPLMPDEPASTHPPMHGLEFEYDLDAPKGRVLLQVIPPMRDAAPILIYDAIVDGGFGRHLKVEDGAVFDLATLENHKDAAATHEPEHPEAAPAVASGSGSAQATPGAVPTQASKKRFSAFAFRKKTRAAGPAVPVVDAQTTNAGAPGGTTAPSATAGGNADGGGEEEGGVRVRIRIDALDEQDQVLASPNAQTTYLHIVRVGSAPMATPEQEGLVEDTRPWVVKVVKREATIGLHTFHLHEIYGLAAGSNSDTPAATSHTYPPNANADGEAEADTHAYDFAGTECVLCLSEPREVVLLPCRHLVACKECAMNMIEFGAGGTVVHAEEPAATPAAATPAAAAATPAADAAAAPNANPTAAADVDLEAGNVAPALAPPVPLAPAPPVPAPRRKRKAKGWFCPVCRQPYTSMLRITTTPPEAKKLTSASETELEESKPAAAADTTAPAPAPDANGGGWTAPGFIRALSIGRGSNAPAAASEQPNEMATSASTEPVSTTSAPVAAPSDPLGATQPTR